MRRLVRTIGVVLLLSSGSLPALAAPEVTVSMSASPTELQVNQTFQLEVRAQVSGGSLDDLKLPDLADFEVLARQVSTPIQFSFGTGRGAHIQSTKIYTFRLRPLRAGTIELAPAEAKVDGKLYRSNAVTIRVSADGAPPQPAASPITSDRRVDPYAFLQTTIEPRDPFVGQQVTISVELYTRLQIAGRTVVPRKPATEGFWIHELPSPEFRPREVLVEGTPYRAYTLYRFAAFPQRTGKLEIGAPEVSFDTAGFGLFDPTERVERRGTATEVDVRPLPEPVPANVVVGKFELSAALDRTQVRTGDAVTLVATVVGTGNVHDVQIALPPMKGIRALDPRVEDNIEAPRGMLEGRRTYEWILVPEQPGEHIVPALEVASFDPATRAYTMLRSQPVAFTAAGNASAPAPSVALIGPPKTSSPDVTFGPIRTRSELKRSYAPIREKPWFTPALVAPSLLFVCFMLLVRIRRRLDQRQSRSMQSAVRGPLGRAEQHIKRGDAAEFYSEIAQTIVESLKLRLDEPVTGMTHPELRELLLQRGAPDELATRIIDELEGCDFARFSSAGTTVPEMTQCLGRTQALVERVDRVAWKGADT